MGGKKFKRPLGVKLILAYNILHIIFIIYSMVAGYGGIISILYIFALYYGLWKMRKDWMFLLLFGLVISTLFYLYQMFIYLDLLSMLFVILNSASIYWLYANRKLFK